MSTRRILRWDVPITNDPTMIGAGPVVHVAMRPDGEVPCRRLEVWTDENCPDDWPRTDVAKRAVIVVGTGRAIPPAGQHIGSVEDPNPDVRLVWHVLYA